MRFEKKQLVEDIKEELKRSNHLFLVGYRGLRVADFNELRHKLDEKGAECRVVPNILFKKAAEDTDFKCVAEDSVVHGDNAMVIGGEDAVAVAKALCDFADEKGQLSVKAGCLDGNFLSGHRVGELADLPSREELLGQLLGLLQAPTRNLVSLLNRKTSTIVYALKAYMDKKENQQ